MVEAVPVVVAFVTDVVPLNVVLPLSVLSPAIDSVPVVCTKPDPSTTIFPPELLTAKPFVKFSVFCVPFETPSC
jgi:hypothetical protein